MNNTTRAKHLKKVQGNYVAPQFSQIERRRMKPVIGLQRWG